MQIFPTSELIFLIPFSQAFHGKLPMMYDSNEIT